MRLKCSHRWVPGQLVDPAYPDRGLPVVAGRSAPRPTGASSLSLLRRRRPAFVRRGKVPGLGILRPRSHERGGSGEPLVLIHGIGSAWQMWEPVLTALRREREVDRDRPAGLRRVGAARRERADDRRAGRRGRRVPRRDRRGSGRTSRATRWAASIALRAGPARPRRARRARSRPPGSGTAREHAYARRSLRNAQRLCGRLDGRLERSYAQARVAADRDGAALRPPDRLPTGPRSRAARNLAEQRRAGGRRSTRWPRRALHRRRRRRRAGRRSPGARRTACCCRARPSARARRCPQARHVTLLGCGHVPTWDDPELVARRAAGGPARG